MKFTISGEQSDVALPLVAANVVSSPEGLVVKKVQDDSVFLEGIKKGAPVEMEVRIDFDNYCMMEVDYYESKK